MKRNLWRLALALFISSSCFIGTVIWFEFGKSESSHGDHAPVARLNSATNEVQRKPLKRVIWESVAKNDELYPGEAIRTAPNAEAQLFFIKNGTTVHLDPDSLVVLEENDHGLSLDFLQGNLFVQSDGSKGSADGLTLKTGGGEIKLNSADMSLSKSKNGHVALEVHRGEAELSQGSQKTSLDKNKSADLNENGQLKMANDRMLVLKPLAGQTLFLNLSKGEKIDLNWKPLPAGYTVTVEVGANRSALEVMSGSAAGEVGKLNVDSKPGRWYMRVVAKSANANLPALASTVIPFTIEPKAPPALVEPRQEASVMKSDPKAEQIFRWVDRNKFTSQVFEVASDANFKNIKVQSNLAGELTTNSVALPDGKYFWRVTGFLKVNEKSEALVSPIGKFSITSNWEVKPPTLLAPANGQHLSFMDVQKSGANLKWQIPSGVERLKVTVEKKTKDGWKSVSSQLLETPFSHLSDLEPGLYQWKVASLDPRGGAEKPAAAFQFTVEDMLKIEWADATPSVEYVYKTPTPTLSAPWKSLPGGITASYRFKVAPASDGLELAKWQSTKQTNFDISVPGDGGYQAIIEALNVRGQLVGQSDVKTFTVKRMPLLPAPQWTSATPEILKGDGRGNLSFAWESVQGADRYLMILESPDGKVIQQKEISRTTASLNRLKPGQYQVHLKSVDGFKRPGLDGAKRKIEVPNSSDIGAPKIRAMKVK